ncbi:winged helix-turn-helix transcriptional regulator [bacterium]|nr:winged helix-turn-helix transcriptional regulator [bacterium]
MVNRAKEFISVLDILQENMSIRDEELKKCPDLSKIDCFLLQFLYNSKGKVIMNDLADILKVSHSRVTRIMDNLCDLKLTKREHSEEDRRQWYAVLTLEGEYRAQQIFDRVVDHQKEVLKLIPKDKLDGMLEFLVIYSKAFQQITKKIYKEGEI